MISSALFLTGSIAAAIMTWMSYKEKNHKEKIAHGLAAFLFFVLFLGTV